MYRYRYRYFILYTGAHKACGSLLRSQQLQMVFGDSSSGKPVLPITYKRPDVNDRLARTQKKGCIDVDCLRSAVDRYGIDESGSGSAPWIPAMSDNCRSYYDYILLELGSTTPSNSPLPRDPAVLRSYAWKLSLWKDSSSRLSSDLVVPFFDYFNSRTKKPLYALELPPVIDSASVGGSKGMIHLVVELIHELTAVPISHHTVHLQIDVFDRNDDSDRLLDEEDSRGSRTQDRTAGAAAAVIKDDEYYLKKYPALGNTEAVVLRLGACNSISFQPRPFSSFATLLPSRDFEFTCPIFEAVVSVQPAHAKACHWQLHPSYRIRPFPAYVPSSSEVLLHLINEQKRQKELSPAQDSNLSNYISDIEATSYSDVALDRRVYATVVDLQLVPDLTEMCGAGNITVLAHACCGDEDDPALRHSDIDSAPGSRAAYLGSISRASNSRPRLGDWLTQSEVRVLDVGSRIKRIKFSVNYLTSDQPLDSSSRDPGHAINLKQVTLCEGVLDSSSIQLQQAAEEEEEENEDRASQGNKWRALRSGCFEILLTVEQNKYNDRMELNLGKIIVKIDIAGDGLESPLVASRRLERRYNDVVSAFMSKEPLPPWVVPLDSPYGAEEEGAEFLAAESDRNFLGCSALGIVDTLACLASCSVRVAGLRRVQRGSDGAGDLPSGEEARVYGAMQRLISRLLGRGHDSCDRSTVTILATILMEESLYATRISLSLWLRYWILRLAPTPVFGFLAAAAAAEGSSDQQLGYTLTAEDWAAVRCACACLALLRLSRPLDDSVEPRLHGFEEFEILRDFAISNTTIDNISAHVLEKLLAYGTLAATVTLSDHQSRVTTTGAVDPLDLHVRVDSLTMSVVECASFLLAKDSPSPVSLDVALGLNAFVAAVTTASHIVMADSIAGAADPSKRRAYDMTPNQRAAALLALLTAVLRTLPAGLVSVYAAPEVGQGAERDLPTEDAHAAAICESLSSSVISVNKLILASSVQTDAHSNSFQLLRNYLLVQTSLTSMMSFLSRELMRQLKAFDNGADIADCPLTLTLPHGTGELGGESGLVHMMNRAPFFEAYLACSKVILAFLSRSINSGAPEEDNITYLLHPRALLQRMLNTVIKGREFDPAIVSIVLRSLSYQQEHSYHVSTFLSHAATSICHYWVGLEQLQRLGDLSRLRQNHYSLWPAELRLSFTCAKTDLLHLLRLDFVLFREAASVLVVRGTTDPIFSTPNVVGYLEKRRTNHGGRPSRHKEYSLLDMMTVEEALEDGPIAQWVRLWQQLLMALSDFIKSVAYIGICDPMYLSSLEIDDCEEPLTLQHFIELLCEICILSPLLDASHEQTDHYHAGSGATARPDLVLLCVDDDAHGVVVLKALLSTAATLPISDDYDMGRGTLIGCCVDLMKLLSETPDGPLGLQQPFMHIVDEIVLSTLPDMVPYDGVELPLYLVCPAVYHILGHSRGGGAMSISHSLLMDDHYFSKSGFARTMRCLYTLLFRRGYAEHIDNQLAASDGDSVAAEQLKTFSELISRKLSALRMYVFGKFSCADGEQDGVGVGDIGRVTDSDVSERLYSRFSTLVTAAALQTFLPSSQKFVTSESAFNTIAAIVDELGSLGMYSTGHHSQERLFLRLMSLRGDVDITLPEKEALERSLNIAADWAVDPVRALGYAHVGTAELLKIFVHDHIESMAPALNIAQFERGHHYVRQGTHELVSSGDWGLASRLVASRLHEYRTRLRSLRPHVPAHNRFVALVAELERTQEKIIELDAHDSGHRPLPTFYAVKFSVSPWDVEEVVRALTLQEFFAASCCVPLPARDENAYEDAGAHFYSGSWLVLRCDPTAAVAAAAMYNELIYGEVALI